MVVSAAVAWHFVSAFFRGRASHRAPQAIGAPTTPGASVTTPAIAPLSKQYRVAGTYSIGSDTWVVLADGEGRIRLASPSAFSGRGLAVMGSVDGERVGSFTGSWRAGNAVDPREGGGK